MKKLTPILVLISVLGVGCAYFNTFYNAKQYYKKAYNETRKNLTDKPTSVEKNYYQESIDRSLTLVVRYPESKYVDDALLLAGKAYYYRQEYFKAKRKFLELLTNYPNSPYVAEAQLWMARTHFALDEFEEAENLVSELVEKDVPKSILGQALYYRGKFHEKKRHFDEAADAFHKAIDYGLEDNLANALLALGTSLDTLGRFEDARKAFEKVPKATYLTELDFLGKFYYAQMNKKLGNTDEALTDFQTLLADEANARRIPDIKLQIADTYYRGGEADDAIDYYDEITQLHKGSVQAAEAFYRMARIYEKKFHDYEKALDNYLLVKETSGRSVFADTSEVFARDIQRLQALQLVVDMGKKGETGEALMVESEEIDEDTLTLDLVYDIMDTTAGDTACYKLLRRIGGKIFADSVFEEKNKTLDERQRDLDLNVGIEEDVRVDWREWIEEGEMPSYTDLETEFERLQRLLREREKPKMADNPELSTFRVGELDRNLFLLAELYMFRFESPDSAFNQYDYLVREFPDSKYTPKALYNMAYLYQTHFQNPQQVELIYQTLIDEYGDDIYGKAAAKALGHEVGYSQEDSLMQLFSLAEEELFKKQRPEEAINIYNRIWTDSMDTSYEPKVMYALGYVYENYLDSLNQAYTIYDSLLSKYPDSPFSKKIQPKVLAVKNYKSEDDKTSKSENQPLVSMPGDSAAAPDTTIQVLTDANQDGDMPPEETALEPSSRQPPEAGRRPGRSENRISLRLDIMARRRRTNRQMQMGATAR